MKTPEPVAPVFDVDPRQSFVILSAGEYFWDVIQSISQGACTNCDHCYNWGVFHYQSMSNSYACIEFPKHLTKIKRTYDRKYGETLETVILTFIHPSLEETELNLGTDARKTASKLIQFKDDFKKHLMSQAKNFFPEQRVVTMTVDVNQLEHEERELFESFLARNYKVIDLK